MLIADPCFPGGAGGKDPPANAGDIRDQGSIPGSRKQPGKRNGSPPQYSCPEDPMDRGAWWDKVCGVADLDMTEVTSEQHALLVQGSFVFIFNQNGMQHMLSARLNVF